MANAPCARFTKFINPSVTDSPTLIRNSSTPEAMPSNRTVMNAPSRGRPVAWSQPPRTSGLLLARVFEVRNIVELDVLQLAGDALGLADVDGLHDVARGRIDADRTAGAGPLHALGGFDELLGVGVAIGLLEHLGDQVHAVVTADRHEVGPVARIGLVVGLGVSLVLR